MKVLVFIVLSLTLGSLAQAGIRPSPKDDRWLELDGQAAEELHAFFPEVTYEYRNFFFDVRTDNFRCTKMEYRPIGPQGEGLVCVEYDYSDLVSIVKGVDAFGVQCTKVFPDKKVSCDIFREGYGVTLPARIPFAAGNEPLNNVLGKILHERNFVSSDRKVKLSCITLKPNSYYDCFFDLKP